MQKASNFKDVYTKQAQIAELAKKLAGRSLYSLNHYLDIESRNSSIPWTKQS